MQEQIISFETAKLAKEKGFEDKTNIIHGKNYYNHLGVLNGDVTDYIKDFVKHKQEGTPLDDSLKQISAPTQSLLQKWLREVHGIHVQPQKTFHNKTYTIGKIPLEFRIPDYPDKNAWGKPISYSTGGQGKKFKTYEEALEIGLLVALDAIKEKDE